MKKNRNLIMGLAAIMSLILVVSGIVCAIVFTRGPGGEAAVPTGQALFRADGNHNTALAQQLLALATFADRNSFDVGGEVHLRSTAVHIRDANNGALPEIQLFETIGMPDINHRPDGGIQIGAAGIANFTNMKWRLTYITHSHNGDPIFTFWAADQYRSQIFGDSDYNLFHANNDPATLTAANNTNGVGITGSGGAMLRNILLGDFNAVLDAYSYDIRSDILASIVSPTGLTWQRNQGSHHNLTDDRLYDALWIASEYEISGGIWMTSAAERRIVPNGWGINNSPTAWTRSRDSIDGHYRTHDGNNDSFSRASGNNGYSVRPAIHISLKQFTQPTTVSGIAMGGSARVSEVGGTGQAQSFLALNPDPIAGTTLRFDVVELNRTFTSVTINDINIGITSEAGSIDRSISGVTRYWAHWEDSRRRVVILRVWDIQTQLVIRAYTASI